jgi:acetyl esterase/lipase
VTARANPCRYVGRDSPPMFITHGLEDPLIPYQQSEMLFDAYAKAGASATLCLVPKSGHGDGYLASARLSVGRRVELTQGGKTKTGSTPAPTYGSLLAFLDKAMPA